MPRILTLLTLILIGCSPAARAPKPFVVMTFNTGTAPELPHDDPPEDGYGSVEARLTDMHYGNGLSWKPVVEDTRRFLAELQPDIAVFQEIFYSGDCALVPQEARTGFVCESWQPNDPTVVQTILGAGYQVMCHLGKPDKCAAVKKSFGRFRGCDTDFCLEGLAGARIPDCGGGARVGRGVIDLVGGGSVTVVNVHGSSGVKADDQSCRVKQFEQIFVDLDGQPAANGERNIVLGDFNTDPGRFANGEASTDRLLALIQQRSAFRFITEVGEDAVPSYAGLFNIDHVISDAFKGSCWAAGITEGNAAVTSIRYFDHTPAVCVLEER